MSKLLGIKEFKRLANVLNENKYQCKWCGRKEIVRFDKERSLCSHCGRYIYKNEDKANKYYFAEQLKSSIKSRKGGE